MESRQRHKQDDIEAAAQRSTSMMRNNLFLTLGLLVILFIATSFRAGPTKVEFEKDALSITAPDKSVTRIAYRDIISVDYVEHPLYGECIDGRQDSNCWYGQWCNVEWGEYWLCIRPGTDSCLRIDTTLGGYVINGSSSQQTESWKDMLDSMFGDDTSSEQE